MKIETLRDRIEKAKAKIEKKQNTITKKTASIEKKVVILKKQGVEDPLSANRYDYCQTDIYWTLCDIGQYQEDIERLGKEGRAKVESILAGGYNIQRLHVRVLVHSI